MKILLTEIPIFMPTKHLVRSDVPSNRRKNFKILLGCPTYDGKGYIQDEYCANITNKTYNNYDICLVDNSATFVNKKILTEKGLFTIHVPPKGRRNEEVIAESLEILRNRTLKNGYDFLLIQESDILSPPNVIERLLLHQKMVVSGSYFIGQGAERHLMIQEVENIPIPKSVINIDRGKDILFADGKLHMVYSAGIGCVLIHRDVLKEIKFRYEPNATMHPDSFFSADLFMHKPRIEQYLDTSILCEHHNESWAGIVR